MKYFVKFEKGFKHLDTIEFKSTYMFITCDDIEKAWYEYKEESDCTLKLIDITPLPN